MIIDGVQVNGVTSDSRKVKPGFIFVAIKGDHSDGNNFIEEAIAAGASVIYTEGDLQDERVIIKKVKDARKKLSELCNEFYDFPAKKLKVIGVTGTNGKTTTTHLIHHILRENGITAGLIGTLDIKINDKSYETTLTTPIAEEVYYYMHKMVESGIKVVVMEASSHGLKSERVHQIDFDVAVHTNIEKDHLNYHKTFEDYVASKKKLFDQLSSGSYAVINIDDENSLKLLENNQRAVVLTYGLNKKSTITASSIDGDGAIFFNYCLQRGISTLSGVVIDPFEYPIELRLIGDHNVYNALAAISCCLLLDLDIEKIAKAIRGFKSLPRRMEIIYQDDYVVIDDFCHNPASYEAVFASVQGMQYNDLHIICCIRGNRGTEINMDNARVLKQWVTLLNVKSLVVTASKDCTQLKDEVDYREREGFLGVLSQENIPYHYEERLQNAIERVKPQLKKNDLVLLLGSQGMDKAAKIWLKDTKRHLRLREARGDNEFYFYQHK
ncbi:Mur ligase family protein [Alkaliphilus crotonatoxidans]